MLGREEEREHARQEGVDFQFLTIPLRFLGDDEGRVTGVECQQMELGEPDESGRRRPVPLRSAPDHMHLLLSSRRCAQSQPLGPRRAPS